MLRSVLIAVLGLWAFAAVAQDDENNNPLPPGPARVGGYITNGGQPLEAVVRLKCRNEGKKLVRDFKTYGRGEYSVYIPETAEKVALILLINGKEVARYEPAYWGEGSVSTKDWVVPVDP